METMLKPEGFQEELLHVMPEYITKELELSELTKHLYISDIGVFPRAQYHYRERSDGCNAHIVIYCTDGEGWIELENRKPLQLSARHLAVVPAGIPHRYGASSHSPWSIHWFHLHGDHAAPLFKMYNLYEGPIYLPHSINTKFLTEFEHCYELLSNKAYSMAIQVHVSNVFRELLSDIGMSSAGSTQDKKRENYMESAIRYMNDHLDVSITLADLAKHTGVSKQHLIFLFKKETGFPPVEYFLRLKIQKASQMLDLTALAIKEIGNAIGISDAYYFSRLFKKMKGVSPTEYRKIPKG